jgi:hypothetical protein
LAHGSKKLANIRRKPRTSSTLRESPIPVAFPTETIYSLGADATRSDTVRGIYKAKQRPSDNPLIVHVGSLPQLRSPDCGPGDIGGVRRVHVAVDDEPGVVGLHVAEDVEATDMEVVGVRWKGRRFLPPFHRYLDTSGSSGM